MKNVPVFIVALALIFSPSLLESEELEEAMGSHHEHPGISDASPVDPDHEHGDADDHHSSPDSPCHHHVVHCCCSHAHTVLTMDVMGLGTPDESRRITDAPIQVDIPPSVKSLLHVPLA